MDAKLKQFPKAFLELLETTTPKGRLHSVCQSFLVQKPTCIRINTLKASENEIISILRKENILFDKDRFLPCCYYLHKVTQKKIQRLSCYQEGKIYLQNPSSQIPALVLNPKPNENIIDLCASPGSKTSHLSSLMKKTGKIIALEPDKIRYQTLAHNMKLLGCDNVTCLNTRSESFCKQWLDNKQNLFDRVLVDVPCSGSGTFYIHQKSSFHHWTPDFVTKLSKLQQKILDFAIQITKPGGFVLYSTCSLSIEENEQVLNHALLKNNNAKLLPLPTLTKQPFTSHPLINFKNITFQKQISNSVRILPTTNHEGFFVGLISVS